MLSNRVATPLYRLRAGKAQGWLLPAALLPRSRKAFSNTTRASRSPESGLNLQSFRPSIRCFTPALRRPLPIYTAATRYFSSTTRNMSDLPLSVELTAPNGTKWTQPTGEIPLLEAFPVGSSLTLLPSRSLHQRRIRQVKVRLYLELRQPDVRLRSTVCYNQSLTSFLATRKRSPPSTPQSPRMLTRPSRLPGQLSRTRHGPTSVQLLNIPLFRLILTFE